MTTREFTIPWGVAAPAGAVANPLTNIRRKVPPPALVAAFEGRLTGAYSEIQLARISKTWLDLYDAGLIGPNRVMDYLQLPLLNQSDSLINWAAPGQGTVNGDFAPWTRSKGFALTGDTDYLGSGIVPGLTTKYQLAGASLMINITDATTLAQNAYAIGNLASGSTFCTLQPYSTSTTGAVRLNNTNPVTFGVGAKREGLYIANRAASDSFRVTKDGVQVANPTQTATTVPAGELVAGKQSSADGDLYLNALGFGGGMTAAQQDALARIVQEHVAAVSLWP